MEKEYLKLLVNEIRIEGKEAHISGSYAALAGAIAETKLAPQSGLELNRFGAGLQRDGAP